MATETMSMAALQAELAKLQRENASLKAAHSGPVTCKVGVSGAISVYGLQRMPVTLYDEQWERLLSDETRAQINAFRAANADRVKTKGMSDEEWAQRLAQNIADGVTAPGKDEQLSERARENLARAAKYAAQTRPSPMNTRKAG